MFVDASALVAIILREPEADAFLQTLEGAAPITSAISVYEATLAISRASGRDVGSAKGRVEALLATADIRVVPIGEREAHAALDAHGRYGKGRHPARLNLGDGFAYACARTHRVSLLFKGEDFALTDVAAG